MVLVTRQPAHSYVSLAKCQSSLHALSTLSLSFSLHFLDFFSLSLSFFFFFFFFFFAMYKFLCIQNSLKPFALFVNTQVLFIASPITFLCLGVVTLVSMSVLRQRLRLQ